jgi:hypothetical protein
LTYPKRKAVRALKALKPVRALIALKNGVLSAVRM